MNHFTLPSVDCLLHKVKTPHEKIRFIATSLTNLIYLKSFGGFRE